MSPVESQAAGKPVIGIAEGGLLETVKHGETGYLIGKDLKKQELIRNNSLIDDIIVAVEWMSPEKALHLKDACLDNARNFRSEIFFKKMDSILGFA